MHARMTLAAVAVLLPGVLVPTAEEFATVEVRATHPLAPGTVAELQITTGQLPRGARLIVSAASGQVLGAVAPFPPGSTMTKATLAVPTEAMTDGHLRLRLQVVGPGTPPRAPHSGEVGSMELVRR